MIRDLNNITDKFTQIDTKILELLQCASDDFMGLNANFKELFRSSTSLSKNATEIFEILSDRDTKRMMAELDEFYKILRKSHTPIVTASIEGANITKEMLDIAGNLHLQVKNLNQNLLTLKFLVANLKITGTGTPEQSSSVIDELTGNYNKHINQQKLREYQNDKSLEKLQELINNSIVKLDALNIQLDQQVNLILDQVHTSIMLFADKQQEVSRQLPLLKGITDQISESIANIITNLQYHDIIRQKIEHVQTSHRSLLQSLSDFDSKNEGQHLDYLSRIRDLANIQAALLVRANKEYQRAIELITEKFRSISDDMSNMSMLCKELSQSQLNQEEIHFADLGQKLDSILDPLKKVPQVEDTLSNELKEVIEFTAKTLASVAKPDFAQPSDEALFAPLDSIETLKKVYPQGNIVDQLKEVGLDVEKISNQIQTITQRFNDVNKRLKGISQVLASKRAENSDQCNMASKISALLEKLKQQDGLIFNHLDENFRISKAMDTVVAGSVKQIKYYDFFEVRILEIIRMLNEAFVEIKGNETKKEDTEDMEFLKTLYTMESEHKIHESIILGHEMSEDQKLDSPEEQDNDEVELF